MARTQDMTAGSPARLIALFALPILAGNALQQLYSLVDSLIIGRVDGVTSLAAVSSSGWLDWCILSIAMGLAQGFSIQIAQSFGANDSAALRRASGQSALLAVAATVLLCLFSQLFLLPILRLMATPEETFPLTALYLRIIFAGLPVVMAVNVFSGFLRSVGDSRTPLRAMTFATLVNIGLDLLFVGVFHWGVAGAALATVSAQLVSCWICAAALRTLPILHPRREDLRPDPVMIRRLLRLGMPIAFQNLIISVGGLVVQGVVNARSFVFMAGYSAASRLQGLIEMAGGSVGSAVGTFAGQNLGAGRLDRVRSGLRQSVWMVLLLALAVSGSMVLFGRNLLMLFIREEPGLTEEVLRVAYSFLCVMSAGLPMLYLLFVYRSTLQGIGDTFIPMISGFVELAMRVSAVLILPRFLGEWGMYIAEITAWIGAAVLLIIGYYRRIRKMSREA